MIDITFGIFGLENKQYQYEALIRIAILVMVVIVLFINAREGDR
jgi:hypothetical protein